MKVLAAFVITFLLSGSSAIEAYARVTTSTGAAESLDDGHLVSVVLGCIRVPYGLRSFVTTQLRDAFSGKVAAAPEAEAVLTWLTGLWDAELLLRSFNPSAPPPGAQATSAGGAIWRARRDRERYIVAQIGRAVVFGKASDEAAALRLTAMVASYRAGSAACRDAESALPIGE